MTKRFYFLVIAFLMGCVTVVNAKINYVPLYISDTGAEKHTPSIPLFITQDGHKLLLPEFEDSLTFKVFKDNNCIYNQRLQANVTLPTTLVGDYEVRLCADTYYYYGFITLDKPNDTDIPNENANWENITLLGSNTSQQVILDYILGLNVVEYNMKMPHQESLKYLSEEDREAYIKQWEENNGQLRYGLLPEELEAIFPSLVIHFDNGDFGINYLDIIPILISCIQELKVQLDARTETIVDIMMSRGTGTTEAREVRAAIGNTLLSAAPTSVGEPALVRFLLTDDASNAYIAVTDMGGRLITKMPVSPSETSASVGSGILGEGIYLCTLIVNGENVGTKRLVKTKK